MLPFRLTCLTILATALVVIREAPAQDKPSAKSADNCTLFIQLTDATGRVLPGNVSIRNEAGQRVSVPELLPRGLGVPEELAIHDWHVLPGPAKVTVPQEVLKVKAFHGLETEFGEATLDLRGKTEVSLKIQLKRFYDAHARGLQSANTHVHLMKTSLKQADRYLLEVSRAERLEIVYISYLERAEADLEYTSNKYARDDLRRLTKESHGEPPHRHGLGEHHHGPGGHSHGPLRALETGTEFDNGQEHRHNFAGFDEGYVGSPGTELEFAL